MYADSQRHSASRFPSVQARLQETIGDAHRPGRSHRRSSQRAQRSNRSLLHISMVSGKWTHTRKRKWTANLETGFPFVVICNGRKLLECWSFVSIRNQLKLDKQTRAICRLCSLPNEIRYARENDRGCMKTMMKFVFFIASELTTRFPPLFVTPLLLLWQKYVTWRLRRKHFSYCVCWRAHKTMTSSDDAISLFIKSYQDLFRP